MKKHLWEIDHPYYCEDANYYHGDSVGEFKSWADFMAEYGDSDFDMNLIFRFDWKVKTDDDGNPLPNKDPNYRDGNLHIYWMGQRKGLFHTSIIEVCRNDEAAVIEFLKPRYEHLKKLWKPL